MLVLGRKRNEVISIGKDIKIMIVCIRGNLVRVGIEAPKSVKIRRGELNEREDPSITEKGSSQEKSNKRDSGKKDKTPSRPMASRGLPVKRSAS